MASATSSTRGAEHEREDMSEVPLLAIDDLAVEFRTRSGTVRALERVGFALARGETLGIVGESRSGKSVTALAIMGILDAAARVTAASIVFRGLHPPPARRPKLQEMPRP